MSEVTPEAKAVAEEVAAAHERGPRVAPPNADWRRPALIAVGLSMVLAALAVVALIGLTIARYSERRSMDRVVGELTEQIDRLQADLQAVEDARATDAEAARREAECRSASAAQAEAAQLELVITIAETFGGVLETGERDTATLRERAQEAREALGRRLDSLDTGSC